MGKKSVRNRIFISNTLMVVTVLVLFLCINTFVMKFLAPGRKLHENAITGDTAVGVGVEGQKQWEYDSDAFLLYFILSGILCIGGLLGVSFIFTDRMAKRILTPLEKLGDGAERIRSGNLAEDIEYSGENEFENVCHAFNEMQHDILAEREQLKKYEKARTDMIAGISHDLRTPLTAIRGTVKGLMDGVAGAPDMQQKFLETAYLRTGEMEALLQQLFFFSTMETGKLPIRFSNISLNRCLEQYVCEKQADVKLSEVTFSFAPAEKDLAIWADPEQLRRILDNLLENSLKYAEVPALQIGIEAYREKRWAMIRFSDNGAGIPPTVMEHIFEEFYRGDDSRNRKKGNGLGLYIVKYLMEAMGGSVRAEHREGLAITLSFPLKGVRHVHEGDQKNPDC